MILSLKLKEAPFEALKDRLCAISKDEWPTILQEVETVCEEMPQVFIIDGFKFKIAIAD